MAVNWPGLLAWSTKYHDGTKPSEFKQMSQEDKEFLEKAMEEAFGQMEDPNVAFQEAIEQIKSPERTQESIATSLEVIDRLCDDPDVARNAEKLDGIQPLLDLAKLDTPQQSRTLEILALLFSNNPNIQQVGFKRGALQIFVDIMQNNPVASEPRTKAFRTLAALVRSEKPIEEAFLQQHAGAATLVACLSMCEPSSMREKALSLVRSLAQDGCLGAEETSQLAVAVAPLLQSVSSESIQHREMLASCCLALSGASVPSELRTAVQLREQQLAADKSSTEDSNELSLLKECLER
mmetsp:Transcript_70644/g.169291  ORF Transcript_70644/g.169291 Transcript_70644/m.169291 type:complete len:294 (+) Transcript_70644:88-969(+)|eukprot:CAMPEP_0178406304 /NCGR_PEP_ID=MMETSP0689_2-20121128/18843_1 /TAXON_ID=160604 /ORGANISM="Amphidinium massartii, Strain CS-259" /LENGTH=293 /DNA_ID=CAMNT_0020027341 /DNA_START=83 /DNA_END=964 /DNA_ORIENTATION=+